MDIVFRLAARTGRMIDTDAVLLPASHTLTPDIAMNRAAGGDVFWVTGLSGAGKTTVATILRDRLVAAGRCCVLLDGDVLRAVLGAEGEHSPEARHRLAFTYARLCRELAGQGLCVVCATISMFHDVRRWNRESIPGYHEIYLRVPEDERIRRDAKGLYAQAAAGRLTDMIGVHHVPELPDSPDLVIDNVAPTTPHTAVDAIATRFFVRQAGEQAGRDADV
jgi:adenylylsulfate kinase